MAEVDLGRDEQPVSDARANLTELLASVRHARRAVILTSRNRAVAAVVPAELGQLIRDAGGPDVAVGILRAHLAKPKRKPGHDNPS